MERGNDSDWINVYSTDQLYKAEMMKSLLSEHQIECVMVNKKDSAYVTVGSIELFVPRDQILRAINLVQKNPL